MSASKANYHFTNDQNNDRAINYEVSDSAGKDDCMIAITKTMKI